MLKNIVGRQKMASKRQTKIVIHHRNSSEEQRWDSVSCTELSIWKAREVDGDGFAFTAFWQLRMAKLQYLCVKQYFINNKMQF